MLKCQFNNFKKSWLWCISVQFSSAEELKQNGISVWNTKVKENFSLKNVPQEDNIFYVEIYISQLKKKLFGATSSYMSNFQSVLDITLLFLFRA